MYKTLADVCSIAEQYNFTVGAFNAHCLEMLPAMILAAHEKGAPIIIQTSVGTARCIGMKNLVAVCDQMADDLSVDVCLHLDHAKSFEDIKDAINAGYSSVMFDGSALSFKENILKTQEVVAYAHPRGVSVEAELGTINGAEDTIVVDEKYAAYTDPQAAVEFVEATNIDALAVSIGTCHGSYKAKTKLNFELLEELHELIDIPMVVHGGTGVADEDIKRCINNGIRKFNVGTELLVGWTRVAMEQFGNTKENESLRNNLIPCNEKVKEIVENKIELFLNK